MLTDAMLYQCLVEAEERKSDSTLPLDVRIRSAQTFADLLRAAHGRGHDYQSLKEAASCAAT